MLLQITNQCFENCPHCMQDSNPNGHHMSREVFSKALEFGEWFGFEDYVFSGGEPTLSPYFFDFIDEFDRKFAQRDILERHYFVCSNGTWITDENKRNKIRDSFKSSKHFIGCQIYSNKFYYKDYDKINYYGTSGKFAKLGCYYDNEFLHLKDLGRARKDSYCIRENAKEPYFCSCLNTSLLSKQLDKKEYAICINSSKKLMCKPLIDINGYVHMSESWLCPSVGNIRMNSFEEIWNNMVKFKPCMQCADSKRLKTSVRDDIKKVVKLLGI